MKEKAKREARQVEQSRALFQTRELQLVSSFFSRPFSLTSTRGRTLPSICPLCWWESFAKNNESLGGCFN
jgi:hypothetical protein